MKLSNINKKIILSAGLIFAINAFAIGALLFINMTVKEMNNRVAIAKNEIILEEKKANEARALKESLSNLSIRKEKLDSVFIEQKDVLSFIKEIENLAKESGVDMEFRSVDISKNDSGEKPIFQFKATGPFSGLFYYLVLLENIKYQIVFDNITFQKIGGSGNKTDLKWEATFSVRLLSYN